MQRLVPRMERQESASVDPSIAALLDVCDMLAQFHRELQQLRARQRHERETHSETAESTNNSTVNAAMGAEDRRNVTGASVR